MAARLISSHSESEKRMVLFRRASLGPSRAHAAFVHGRGAPASRHPGVQIFAPVADPAPKPVKHKPVARDPVARQRLRRQPEMPGRLLRVQNVAVLRDSRLLVFDGPDPCPQIGADACAAIEAKETAAGDGRSMAFE